MASSMASSLLRRTLRRSLSSYASICSRHRHYSSLPSSSLPLLARSRVSSPQTLTLAKTPAFLSARFFSLKVKADETLKKVLEAEIECAEEEDGDQETEVISSKDFPFEIIDNPGEQTIFLKREFAGENIQVTVFLNLDEENREENEDEDEDRSGDDDNYDNAKPTISLVVTIDKGADKTLEFCCNLNSEGLEIESLVMKRPEDSEEGAYEGPSFSDLDESLQNAFHKYLSVRGISGSHFNFLYEYMMKKEDKEYLVWLQNMKKFVEI